MRYGGPVAQRLEQRTHNPLVPGSNPGGPTTGFSRLTCLLALRLPAIGGCSVQAFRDLHGPLIFLPGLPEHPFFHSGVHPDFPRGQTRRGPGSRRRRRVALALFPVPS